MNFLALSKRSVYRLALIPAAALVFSCNNPGATNEPVVDSANTMGSLSDSAHGMEPVPMVQHAEAIITGTSADTSVTGTVKFDAADGKVKMDLEITIPAKAGKSVAVHIHEHGDCGDGGKMSHGHWNPTNKAHGKWGSAEFHLGDIGNVELDSKGKGTLSMETDLWTLGGTPDKNILNKAIIVHGGMDDYTTQPTGNAGSRIGCGVIQ
ncbi:MAG TPA: superoxide dismutase family protein [Agriterribacter sp.]|nr:superoxide dismutase family protein [Agriterribacter sp.]